VSGVPWRILTGSGLDHCTYWHCYYNRSYLQSVIPPPNQWLRKTRSIPYWTTSVFSSTVTDFVLIYESVTSSASVVRWLALHSWTLNYWTAFWILEVNSLTNELSNQVKVKSSESSQSGSLGVELHLGLMTRYLLLFDSHGLVFVGRPLWREDGSLFRQSINVKVKVILRLTVSLGVEPHLGLITRYLLLFDSYGLVFVGRPLWREVGSVFCICCWSSPA
jgi:hypothetical protein